MSSAIVAGTSSVRAIERLRLTIAFAAGLLAILGAAGLTAPFLFADPDRIKYAATVVGPLVVLAACVADDPLRVFVGASIVAAPFSSLVATFAGQEVSVITPLLIASVGLAVATGRVGSSISPVGAAAVLAGALLIVPLASGDWGPYLTLILVASALAYTVARVARQGPGGLRFVLGALVASAATQAVIALWEFQTGNQFNPYRESASAVFGRNYFFGFEDLNRPSAALFDPISLGNVLALALPVAIALGVTAKRNDHRFVALTGRGRHHDGVDDHVLPHELDRGDRRRDRDAGAAAARHPRPGGGHREPHAGRRDR